MKLIVAHGRSLEIGKEGDLPWKIKEDLIYFAQITKQASFLISGRKTLASIPGKKLPGRKIVVVSTGYQAFHDEIIVGNPNDILSMQGVGDAIVIGGETMYRHFLHLCSELLITSVDTDVLEADTFFPKYMDKFALKDRSERYESNGLGYEFQRWVKKTL